MKAAAYLIDPVERRIRALPMAPGSRELLTQCIDGIGYVASRLHVHSLGFDVPVVDDAGRRGREEFIDGELRTVPLCAPLILATGWQPARPGNESEHYTLRGLPFTGRAVLAARVPGVGPIEEYLGAPTQMLRLAASPAEVAGWIDWEPKSNTETPALPYDLAMLEAGCKLIAEIVGDRGVARMELRDLKGNSCGGMNFQGGDWRGIRRYCLDAFDRNTTPVCDWTLRRWPVGGVGDQSESPIASQLVAWSERKAGAAYALHVPGRAPLYGRLTSESAKGKAEWLPFPGVPYWQPSGESPMVTLTKSG